jgi:hypothetical protein
MRSWSAFLLGLAVSVVGCGDDAAEGDGSAGATESGTAGEDVGEEGPMGCTVDDDCDPVSCMEAVCREGLCEATGEKVLSNDCRPQIDVDYPPRAATIEGADASVTVTGTVSTGAGDITSLELNGHSVTVSADGSFSHTIDTAVGGNVLVFEAADSYGQARKRVQSFLWSTGYDKPTTPNEGMSAEGFGFYLGQNSIDDGVRDVPPNDLADIFHLVLASMDLGELFDANEPILHQAGYDIYLTDLVITSTDLSLDAIDGGMALHVALNEIVGDLYFDCTSWECELAGGTGTGGLSIESVLLDADIMLSVEDNQLVVDMQNVNATVDEDGIDVWADNGWTDFLLGAVQLFVDVNLSEDLELMLEDAVENQIGPALVGGLAGLAINMEFEFPSLADDGSTNVVDLITDFNRTDFHDGVAPPDPSPPQGGLIALRAGGYAQMVRVSYENLGIPRRDRCGQGGQEVAVPRLADLEIGLTDDMINQLLYAGWQGGLLEFPLDSESLGDNALIDDIDVVISGMLAPTASDCNERQELLAQIGDIRIDATLVLSGTPVEFVAFITATLGIELGASDEGISINITGVDEIYTELTADDDSIELEPTLVNVLEGQLSDLLGGLGDGLGGFELPEFDLSESVGLPPGTAVLSIQIHDVTRVDGTTVVSGSF